MADLLTAPAQNRQGSVKVAPRTALRKWIAFAHLWIGLPIGLLVCVFTLSGGLIVFRVDLEDALGPQRAATEAGPCKAMNLDAASQQVAAFAPGSAVTQIAFPQTAGGKYQFTLRNPATGGARVVYDSCSGQVLGTLKLPSLDWLVDFHQNLLAGKTGRQLTGVIGIVLFLLA